MKIGVAYGNARRQVWLNIELDEGATVSDAIERSGILKQFPEINLEKNKVGVYSKIVPLDSKLVDGDRVEIYAPLTVDPKTVKRRAKAEDPSAAES